MRNFLRKTLLGSVFIALLVLLGACAENAANGSSDAKDDPASDYPSGPITVVVPAGAGGDTDLNTRIMAKYLEKELDTNIVISNVTGAGGATGTQNVLDAKADGHTVLAFHNSMLLNNIFGLTDYTYTDFKMAGVGVLDQSNTFVTSADSKFNDLPSLIEYAKENPGEVTMATEIGSMTYIQTLQFQELTGVEFNIVDIGGASDKISALLGGRVDIVPTSLGLISGYIESGDMIPLGIMGEERLEGAPDVPTFKEQGVDIVIDKAFYWGFHKDTPEEIVTKFSNAMDRVVANEDYQEEIENSWLSPTFLNSEETNKKLEEINASYQEAYKKSEEDN
ncbi:tripartite tricarboxylate transporter substrate binding protein [Oceanobacillus profundus]|uniref:Tripartite tricarboxylate transporter substrate binding protein n=1 Tax=Oceanobacillus profundus TaxID=372463 RepID=A0A417YAY2_9BACI|nr:tripartite tricarboxylate transporter substrate binding protein [Oceanobacillus profundus]MDO6450399.1 tripartite tricarboxylate transporter substrate binding protein [Oceanobacillus profundus]PAE27353.1 argininosuccinate lyase [Paenibacillus sp. 7884-2]RHW29862.1 tripartite tricarboxylate transporter substrate binding protein [Oceanobacillus profundus]